MVSSGHRGEEGLKRVASALLLIPAVVYVVLFAPAAWFLLATGVVVFLALAEYYGIVAGKGTGARTICFALMGALVPFLFFLQGTGPAAPFLLAALGVFFVAGFSMKGDAGQALREAGLLTTGLLFIAVTLSHLVLIWEMARAWVMFVLVLVWTNDTLAYYGGRLFGSHKLAPAISPGKTVEGALAGTGAGVVAAFALNAGFSLGLGMIETVFVSIILGAVGIVGDLSESLVKRGAGVKDSGWIMPGHGGLLDRIDSLLFAAPALYYYLLWRAGGVL